MRKLPEIVYTTVRRIEPVGEDMVRMYCSIENGTRWEDRGTLVLPVRQLLKNAQFVVASVTDLFGESQAATDLKRQLQLH